MAFKYFRKALKLGTYGETKEGKSWLGATFVRDLDGVVLDFARIVQDGGFDGRTPSYHTAKIGVGEAYYACEQVGIDLDRQYHFIKSWNEYELALDAARDYRDNISTKENKRIWLVIDDTRWWRYQCAQYVAMENKHKSISKDDWKSNTQKLVIEITKLEAEFNLLFVNQAGDEYAAGEKTGERSGAFYPAGANFIYDAVLRQWTDKTKRPWVPHVFIEATRPIWGGYADAVDDIADPTPEKILTAIKVEKERW